MRASKTRIMGVRKEMKNLERRRMVWKAWIVGRKTMMEKWRLMFLQSLPIMAVRIPV
jgi:hypothetical protein